MTPPELSPKKRARADTEELRQAMIYYRSLFDELLVTYAVVV